MNSMGYESQNDPHTLHQVAKAQLDSLLIFDLDEDERQPPTDWAVVNGLLQKLSIAPSSNTARCSAADDPMGRLTVGRLLSRNPPLASLEVALKVFPDSLSHNPAAFFTACRSANPEIVASMMRHMLQVGEHTDSSDCPYPWILSDYITVDGTRAILEAYPKGVLQPSSFLSGYNPLDFYLMSREMVEQREFDVASWQKFKLMLVAAQCGESPGSCSDSISPVETILNRVLSRPDFLDDMKRAQHVLWLLHQLRWTDRWVFEKHNGDGKYPLHFVLSHECTRDSSGLVAARELVKILLEAHPLAAKHLVNGRLALHMAVDNGWPCHDLLLALYPEALDAPDPRTELYPFQTSAMRQQDLSSPSLDVTFELLRANPTYAKSVGKAGTRVGA